MSLALGLAEHRGDPVLPLGRRGPDERRRLRPPGPDCVLAV